MASKYALSILIPARNEEWLARTIQDILENSENTQVIAVLDGKWSDPGIPDDDRVTLVYVPESIGQRAATNLACKLSRAKYVMKCDAHVAFDKDFDMKLVEAMEGHDDWTISPALKNLWVFDWKCVLCGHKVFQNPIPKECAKCGDKVVREMVWLPNPRRPTNTAFLFDSEPHFQYFSDLKRRQTGDVSETMSLQGSCFMLTREKYWKLKICDEDAFGSWGSQGIEVAVKTWLSGGKVMVHRKTWYAHLFRTGDFGFPYPNPGESKERNMKYAKDLFFSNSWPLQVKPISWLIEKFWPVPGWTQEDLDNVKKFDHKIPSKGIIFFTDNRLNLKIAHAVQKQLKNIGLPIVSSSLKPMTFGDKNMVTNGERGYHTYFKQIVAALETSTEEIVFFCEHDVLYPHSHFEFTPPTKDKFYYNQNWVKTEWINGLTSRSVAWDADQVSGLVCYRELALDWYRKKLAEYESVGREGFDRKFEPGSGVNSEAWRSKEPYADIRQPHALTKNKWSLADFRDKTTAKNFREAQYPEWAKSVIPVEKTDM